MTVRILQGLSTLAVVCGLSAAGALAQGIPQAGYPGQGASLVSFYDEEPTPPAPAAQFTAHSAVASNGGDGGGCDTCGCDSGCGCDCGPAWTVSAGAVFLIREAGGSGPFLNTPNSSIGTGGSDFQPGGRVSLIKHRDAAFDYEIAYLGFGSNSGFDFASGNLRGSGVAPAGSEIAFATPVALNGSGIYLSHLQSSFNSLEFNVRENVSDYLTILAGFRWINLNERFGFLLASPTDAIAGVTEATNNLLGFQVGADGVLYDMGRFQIDGIAKAGIYGNLADNQTAVIGVPNPGFIAFTDDTTDVAFEADVRLGGTYWLGERFAVRGGYQLIWLEGVALAADQIAAVDLNNRWGLDTSGSPFWHGAYVEAMLTW